MRRDRRRLARYTELPLLFLDVDGPLLPFGEGTPREASADESESGLDSLGPETGRPLAALRCQLVWATTWEDEANVEIAPRLGLPTLPVVSWPEPSDEIVREDEWFGLCWKTRTLVDWAAGRPFAWLDDEITDADREWVSSNHAGEALLRRVEANQGLTDPDVRAVARWLRGL